MKRALSILLFLLYITSILAQEKNDLIFKEKTINLGKIYNTEEKVIVNFPFSNKGDKPLVIYKVTASCGCTIPIWPQTPIKSGEDGCVKIILNSKEIKGFFTKKFFVESNSSKGIILLKIKGEFYKNTLLN